MACSSFNSNNGPQVVFATTAIPSGFCHTTWQATFDEFVSHLTGFLPSTFSSFIISDVEPGVNDRDKVWIKVDTDCTPIGMFLYFGGMWVQVGAQIFVGDDSSGAANSVLVTTVNPSVSSLVNGQIYLIKLANTITGPTVITISSIPGVTGKDIKKDGNQALSGFEALAGSIMVLVWDNAGGYFELTNTRQYVVPTQDGLFNGSFEIDTDGDGTPDKWNTTVNGGATAARDTTGGYTFHGISGMKITTPSGVANAQLITADKFPVQSNSQLWISWRMAVTGSSNKLLLRVDYFDATGAFISGPQVWDNFTIAPNSLVAGDPAFTFTALSTVPLTATQAILAFLYGDFSVASGASELTIDNVRVSEPEWTSRFSYTTTGTKKFITPSNVRQLKVTCIGAGGGGATAGGGNGGGAGGGGGVGISMINVLPSTKYTITVGAAGASGSPGTAGTDSTWETSVVIGDGAQGAGATPSGGAGGSTNTGQWVLSGTTGGSGGTGLPSDGGNGGSTMGGVGGAGGILGDTTGHVGTLGGGGGGGYETSGGGTNTGGNGSDGVVILEWIDY